MASDLVRLAPGPDIKRALAQFHHLQLEMRDTGKVYCCLPGHHDDLAISCGLVAWARRHRHLRSWSTTAFADRMPRPAPPKFDWGAACT
jgi:hypothetical protein